MGLTQLVNATFTEGTLLMATVTPEVTAVTAVTEETDWLPILAVLIGGLIGIGGSTLTHFLSTRNEKARLTAQNDREDKGAKREELKLLYTELIRYLGEYFAVMMKYQLISTTLKEAAENDVDAGEYIVDQKARGEKLLELATNISSSMGLLELIGDREVHKSATAFYGVIIHIDPTDQSAKEKAKHLNLHMKSVMRASLAGEPMPDSADLEKFLARIDDLAKAKQHASKEETPAPEQK